MFKKQEKWGCYQLFVCIYSKQGQISLKMLLLHVSNQRGLFHHPCMLYFWDTLSWDVMSNVTHYSNCCSHGLRARSRWQRGVKQMWPFLNIPETEFMQNWSKALRTTQKLPQGLVNATWTESEESCMSNESHEFVRASFCYLWVWVMRCSIWLCIWR